MSIDKKYTLSYAEKEFLESLPAAQTVDDFDVEKLRAILSAKDTVLSDLEAKYAALEKKLAEADK